MDVLDLQRRLLALGFDPGGADGAWGPRTRAAVIAFQKSAKLTADGLVGPKTVAAMNAGQLHGGPGKAVPPMLKLGEPVWVLEGRRKLGLRETNPEVAKFLKSDGRTVGDPSKSLGAETSSRPASGRRCLRRSCRRTPTSRGIGWASG